VFQFDSQDLPAGPGQLLGLCARSPFFRRTRPSAPVRTRSARWTNFATWSRRYTGPASKSFSTWCSTTPLKATIGGPTLSFRGSGQRIYYILEQDRSRYAQLHPGAGTRSTANNPHCPPHDRGQSPLLGRGDARGRFPVRLGIDPHAGSLGPRAGEPARCCGDIESGPVRLQERR